MSFLLFVSACVGHTAFLVFLLSRWYALPLPRIMLRGFRAFVALAIVGGPLWLVASGQWPVASGARANFSSLATSHWPLATYLLVCWVIGLGIVPSLVTFRLLQKQPQALLSNHTRTLNVAEELGYKPIGRGRYRHLARLPRNEVFQVDFAERALQVPDLPPAWDGLTILHLSDLHFAGSPDREFYQKVMDECRAWEPDLVALTGDFVDSDYHRRWIVPLLGRLRWRIAAFAVLGNHDYWHEPSLIRRRLRRLGIHVLGNTWKQIEVRGLPLVVIGHEGPWFRPGPDLSNCPRDTFRLCLSHTPDNIGWARANNVRLMLSGHNHGGQIRFPLIGSVFVPSLYGRRYDCGLFDEPPTMLHVVRGLAGKQPLRFNCRPEVVKLVLRSSPLTR
jgi:predicted MPP superfamily phosphohydrolase